MYPSLHRFRFLKKKKIIINIVFIFTYFNWDKLNNKKYWIKCPNNKYHFKSNSKHKEYVSKTLGGKLRKYLKISIFNKKLTTEKYTQSSTFICN